jgi:hypothetical protein
MRNQFQEAKRGLQLDRVVLLGRSKNIGVIYPILSFEGTPSEHIPMVQSEPAPRQFTFAEIKTDFEFLVSSNSFLKVTRA